MAQISILCKKSRNLSNIWGIYEDGENSNVLPEFSRESRELPC